MSRSQVGDASSKRKSAVRHLPGGFAALWAMAGLLGLAGLVAYRRRHPRPCPYWLGWALENPYVAAVAGSEILLDRLDLAPGMRVLDAGCGSGRLTIPAALRVGPGGEVVALDIQAEMLAEVLRRAASAGLRNIRPVKAGLGTGQIRERDAFDRILLVTVLGEVPDQLATLRELWAALKPGGILSITEVLPDPDYQRRSTVRKLAEAAGFRFGRAFGTPLAFTANFEKPVPRPVVETPGRAASRQRRSGSILDRS